MQYILGDIHWSFFIDCISSLSMGSSCCFFLAGYTYIYIWPPFFLSIHWACISLAARIQYIDILYIHWHQWVDESKPCGMVSEAWVELIWLRSKGGENGGKYLQSWITPHLPPPITERIKTLQWGSNTSSKEWIDCMPERREINSRQPREPRSGHIYLTTKNHLDLLNWTAFTEVQRTFLHYHRL